MRKKERKRRRKKTHVWETRERLEPAFLLRYFFSEEDVEEKELRGRKKKKKMENDEENIEIKLKRKIEEEERDRKRKCSCAIKMHLEEKWKGGRETRRGRLFLRRKSMK